MSNERGFSLIEGLLTIIVITLVGFTGYYVYNSNRPAAPLSTASAPKNSVAAQPTPKKVEASAAWLLYSPPEKQYTIRLADGWNLSRYQQNSSLNTFNNNDVALKTGTKAVVTQVEGGRDGTSGFGLVFTNEQDNVRVDNTAVKQPSFLTEDGITVEQYKHTETEPVVQGIGQLRQGGVYYNYVIKAAPNKYILASYSVEPGDTQYTQVIEEVLRTVHFN